MIAAYAMVNSLFLFLAVAILAAIVLPNLESILAALRRQ